jgi:hypothetical protein
MPLKNVQQPGQLILDLRLGGDPDMNSFDGLALDIGQRFDLRAPDFSSFISSVDRACHADEALRRNQISDGFEQVGKDDDLDGPLKVFFVNMVLTVAMMPHKRTSFPSDCSEIEAVVAVASAWIVAS